MDDVLLDAVLARLDAKPLADAATNLLLAACQGDEALTEALAGTVQAPSTPSGSVDTSEAPKEPVGAFLRSVTVRAFRGVGPEATLLLQPGPGLTVVVGRNGSGKSTFAEGLEVLLTGSTDRFERHAVFRGGWRNLHDPGPTRVSAALHVAGAAGTTTVERTWVPGADLEAGSATVQLPGEPKRPLASLGWQNALALYRPFLAHSELEAMFGKPSELHDRLSAVLGLEDLNATQTRLANTRKTLEATDKEATKQRSELLAALAELAGDERVDSARAALSARSPDLDLVESIVTGAAEPDDTGTLARLRALTQLAGPDIEASGTAADALRAAADKLAAVEGTDADRARRLADLLAAALDHHASHDSDTADCPVCGRAAALDQPWRDVTTAEVAQLRAEAAESESARSAAASAVRAARALITAAPASVTALPPADLGVDLGPLSLAWTSFAEGNTANDVCALAEHLDTHAIALADAVGVVVAAARSEWERRQDIWSPVARRVAAWVEASRRHATAAPTAKAIQVVEKWLKAAHDDLRNERLRPIADAAQKVWRELRHESNVDLGAIRLTGSATRRQVDLAVDVDGTAGAALGVMSQGEVNALALSIFLPRATLAGSPFRFVVIDDPVQAMDPAKVEGLARVLEQTAASRQVLVFSHDDRLPAAIRRLGIAARILQVHRRASSVVEIVGAGDPASQALRDARAVANDTDVPAAVAARVVPGQCRIAVEAACTDAARRRMLVAGQDHAEVDATLDGARRLTQKAALALFGDVGRAGDVLPRLDQLGRAHADTFQALNKGAHGELVGSPKDTVGDAERLVAALVDACR